ncbi:MAG: PAS domain S-box protein [Sideroxydans sp.]|nr:PAS domain S-box protein [Sideroxydans sp.]
MSNRETNLELELMRSNTLLRTVIDENPNIILMKDWNGKFLIGNRALAQLYGTTPEELVGKDDGAFNPNQEQVAFYLENVREVMRQSETRLVMEESTDVKTGETHYFQSIKKPIIAEDGSRQILVIANDVTELKNAQLKLEESEKRLRYALEATQEGVWDWDIQTGIVSHNPQWCKLTGLNDGFLQHPLEDFARLLHPDDRDLVFERINKCLDGQGPYVSEHRMMIENGNAVWVLDRGNVVERDAAGKATRMVGSFSDISERKSAELALSLRTELLNAIFELSPDGFVSFDQQHKVSYVNPSFIRMTNLDQEKLIGSNAKAFEQTLLGIFSDSTACEFSGTANHRLFNDENDFRCVVELAAPNSGILEVISRKGSSLPASRILYFRDITHESEIDRMKSEFMSTAAHELRTPMASIYGFSEVLLKQELSTAEQREFIQTIFSQSELMVSIINELLDLARIESRRGKDFVFEKFDLGELLSAVSDSFRPENCTLSLTMPTTAAPITITADRNKLTQAINNVLSNAIKYSPKGSMIELEPILPNADQVHDGMVGIRITDHGIGMTQEQQSRVFERFYRADNSGKIPGTGLGMSIVKEIMELHEGRVDLLSQFGKGTAVTLWLPFK